MDGAGDTWPRPSQGHGVGLGKGGPATSTSLPGQQTSGGTNQRETQIGDCLSSFVFIISTCFDVLLEKLIYSALSEFARSRQGY